MLQFIERLGWVLVHSLWQFAAIAILAAVVARMLRRSSTILRYASLVFSMGLIAVAPIVTGLVLSVNADVEALTAEYTTDASLAGNDPESAGRSSQMQLVPSPGERQGVSPPNTTTGSSAVLTAERNTRRADAQALAGEFLHSIVEVLQPWLTWIVGFWAVGVLLCSLRPFVGWRTLQQLRRVGISAPSDEILEAFQRISTRLGVKRVVQVFNSTLAKGPLVVGYLRPVVLLPVSLATSIPMSQLEAILAHELAHIRRHDFVINLLQTMIETLFFYHPGVWWLSHRIRFEREHCCDDLVIKFFNNAPDYGRALLALEQLRGRTTSLALGAKDGSLLGRIRRIVNVGGNETDGNRPCSILIGIAVLFAIMLSSLPWSLAAKDETIKTNAAIKADSLPVSKPNNLAKLPDGIEVEFIGVGYHPSSERDWWEPNGGALKTEPDVSDDGTFTVGSDAQARAKCREFLIQIRGLPKDHSVSTSYEASSASGSSFENGLWTGYHGAGPFNDSRTTVKLSIATEPFGPVQVISRDGAKSRDVPISGDLKSLYDHIVPLDVTEDSNETVLLLENAPYGDLYKLGAWELVAVDTQGVRHRRNSEFAPALANPRALRFPLPKSSISQFEYRMRRYRHFVTFENVSLEPGQKSDVTVSLKSLPSDAAQAFIPNGPMIQLLGVSTPPIEMTSKDKREWWNGVGKLLDRPPVQLGSLHVGPNSANGREFAVRLSGCKSTPITHVSLSKLFQNGQPIDKPKNGQSMYAKHGSQLPEFGSTIESVHWPIGDADAATIQVEFGEAPVVLVKFDANGKRIADAQVDAALQNSPCQQLLDGVKILRTGPHEDGFAVWSNPFSSSTDLGSIDLTLIDKSGNELRPFGSSGNGTENIRSFKVPPADVAAIAIRLQPYTHVVTFENVSLEPGTQTELKVSITAIKDADGKL